MSAGKVRVCAFSCSPQTGHHVQGCREVQLLFSPDVPTTVQVMTHDVVTSVVQLICDNTPWTLDDSTVYAMTDRVQALLMNARSKHGRPTAMADGRVGTLDDVVHGRASIVGEMPLMPPVKLDESLPPNVMRLCAPECTGQHTDSCAVVEFPPDGPAGIAELPDPEARAELAAAEGDTL